MQEQVVLLHTIPETGTHFTQRLLETHSTIRCVSLHTEYSLSALVELFVQGELTHERFDLGIRSCAALERKYGAIVRPLLVELEVAQTASEALLQALAARYPYAVLCLFDHIYFREKGDWDRGSESIYRITDLLHAGYRSKTIIPLRDPILAVASALAKLETPVVIRQGFEYLAQLPSDMQTFFLPIDLLGHIPPEERLTRAGKLFTEFLGLGLEASTVDFILKWPKIGGFDRRHYLGHRFSDPSQKHSIRKVFHVKRLLLKGRNPEGLLAMVDEEIEHYRTLEPLKELFRVHGYRNLCWF